MSLKRKSLSAVLWSGADVFMRQGLQFFVSIILARLLTPEQFGTVALLYLFTGLAGAFIDGGFSYALVQRKEVTHMDESTVFWFNLSMGFVCGGLFWIASPGIAAYFNQPILVPLNRVMAVSLIINALGGVHMALLSKRLEFKKIMQVGAYATVFSGVAAIAAAFMGLGVWALAIQTITSSLVGTFLLWRFSTWRPAFCFSLVSVRELFPFGSFLMMSALLDIAYNRIYTVLIGKNYGVAELGLYNRADNTKQIPVNVLSSTMSRVAFPIFSAAADDQHKLKRGVRFALKGMMLINVPVMFGLMATAENVVMVLFGGKWLPSVPILQVLCLAGVLWPLHVVNLEVLKAQGYSHLFFRLEIIKKVVGSVLIIAGSIYGVMGIAWSQVVFGLLGFIINAYYTQRHLDYGVVDQTKDFLPILILSVIMAVLVFCIGQIWVANAFFKLFLQALIGLVFFIGISHLLKLAAYQDAVGLLKNKVSSEV